VDETSFQPAEILAALERHGVRYIVIGGLAATDVSIVPSGTEGFDDLRPRQSKSCSQATGLPWRR